MTNQTTQNVAAERESVRSSDWLGGTEQEPRADSTKDPGVERSRRRKPRWKPMDVVYLGNHRKPRGLVLEVHWWERSKRWTYTVWSESEGNHHGVDESWAMTQREWLDWLDGFYDELTGKQMREYKEAAKAPLVEPASWTGFRQRYADTGDPWLPWTPAGRAAEADGVPEKPCEQSGAVPPSDGGHEPTQTPDAKRAAGSLHRDCSAKITQRQLESILINEGIIQAAAIEDPYGYDGGKTELAVTIATQQINELISPNGPGSAAAGAKPLPSVAAGGSAPGHDRQENL